MLSFWLIASMSKEGNFEKRQRGILPIVRVDIEFSYDWLHDDLGVTFREEGRYSYYFGNFSSMIKAPY